MANSEPNPELRLGAAEIGLLLACSRTEMSAGCSARLRQLAYGDLDWPAFAAAATYHGVLPLAFRSLQANAAAAVPAAVFKQLQERFYANAWNSSLLATELREIVELFDSAGIPAMPFKGPVLAVLAYGGLSLRQFGDLDILVHPGDAARARQLLFARGYRHWEGRPATFLERFRKVDELIRADGEVLVELHQVFTSGTFFFPMNPEPLWERAAEVVVEGRALKTLPPEELLLFLCVHGAKHFWNRLGWIADVAELVRKLPSLDWPGLLATADRAGGARMLLLGLYLARTLLDAELPAVLEPRIEADARVGQLGEEVRRELFAGGASTQSAVERPAFYFGLRERLRDKARCGLYVAYRLVMPGNLQGRALRLFGLRH